MYCNNCGKEVDNNVKFCTHCGKQIIEHENTISIQKNKTNLKFKMIIVCLAFILVVIAVFSIHKFAFKHNSNDNPVDKQFAVGSYDDSVEAEGSDRNRYRISISKQTWDDTQTINNHLSNDRMFIDDKYYYYLTNGNLYRSKINKNKFECIETGPMKIDNVNVVGELLYYVNDDGFCSYNPQSGKETIICEDTQYPDFMKVYKGYIYYTAQSSGQNNSIYRMKADGTEQLCLREDIIDDLGTLTIYEDYIYFVDQNDRHIYKMSLDGIEKEIFVDDNVDYLRPIYISDGYIYYEKVVDHFRLGSSKCHIYRINLDGTDKQEITTVQSDEYMVYNGKIYYEGYKDWDFDSKVCLCSINVDGTEDKIIEDMKYDGYDDFCIVGDYLLYNTTTDIVSGDTTSFQYTDFCLNMIDNTILLLNVE